MPVKPELLELPPKRALEAPLEATFLAGATFLLGSQDVPPSQATLRALGYHLQEIFTRSQTGAQYARYLEEIVPAKLQVSGTLDRLTKDFDEQFPTVRRFGSIGLLDKRAVRKTRKNELLELREKAKRQGFKIELTDLKLNDRVEFRTLARHRHYDISSVLKATVIDYIRDDTEVLSGLLLEIEGEERAGKLAEAITGDPFIHGTVKTLTGTLPLNPTRQDREDGSLLRYSQPLISDRVSPGAPHIALGEVLHFLKGSSPEPYGVFYGYVANQVVELDGLNVNGVSLFPERAWIQARDKQFTDQDAIRSL